jgi:hypothetical protein
MHGGGKGWGLAPAREHIAMGIQPTTGVLAGIVNCWPSTQTHTTQPYHMRRGLSTKTRAQLQTVGHRSYCSSIRPGLMPNKGGQRAALWAGARPHAE